MFAIGIVPAALAVVGGMVLALVCASPALFHHVQNFLAPTRRAPNADLLIVEGWLKGEALAASKEEFEHGKYRYIMTTGPEREYLDQTWQGAPASHASRGAAMLGALGVDSSKIIAVAAKPARIHRTFAAAQAVTNWLDSSDLNFQAANVFTGGSHGRKSWTVFRRTIGKRLPVGIVSTPRWFCGKSRSLKGRLKLVVKHGGGYFYAILWSNTN